jgi:hypothetical protein
MKLIEHFDAVVMLTWSNWQTEPRSNRYHYAARFSADLPVLFLQHGDATRKGILVESTELPRVDLVNVSSALDQSDIEEIRRLLSARGIRRPLVWIYNPLHYRDLLRALPTAFRVYHATEDYFAETSNWNAGIDTVRDALSRLLRDVDFLVACSQGVADSYRKLGGYAGPLIVANNGCDAEFLLEKALDNSRVMSHPGVSSVIFQGGINQRLDYELLLALIRRMPDWQFRLCGSISVAGDDWRRIEQMPNVACLGQVSVQDLARAMCEATVGIIPFKQDPWIKNSLPLKAYEYVACGLPVVTVPITALESRPDLFTVATDVETFEQQIRRVADSRYDPVHLERRHAAALSNSYNLRFAEVVDALVFARISRGQERRRLSVAMLYDGVGSMHVNTIKEHLESFDKYSTHDFTFIPATPSYWQQSPEDVQKAVDFSIFDAVFVHYSIRLSIKEHFDEGLVRALERFNGLKALFIQDEYEGTEIARAWMDRVHFDLVYTCVPKDDLEKVYPAYRFPATEFLPTLTGYVPEDCSIERYAKPLAGRKFAIAYRGRKLPAVYGDLGQEKYRIGWEMKAFALMRGLPVDIEVDDSKRIYGAGWYEFLGSSRATLGTESGANIFDFDGSLRQEIDRLLVEKPEITYQEIRARVLAPHEGLVHMNQISPKVFEAIRLRTALILFEGSYSGVVQPDVHFIPLKKDFSNIDEVIEKLQDDDFLRVLTDRAYEDVVASGKYSYKCFVEGIDSDIAARVLQATARRPVLSSAMFLDSNACLKQALPLFPCGLWSGSHPMGRPVAIVPEEELSAARQELAEARQQLAEARQQLAESGVPPGILNDAVATNPALSIRVEALEEKVSSPRYFIRLGVTAFKIRVRRALGLIK